MNPDGMWLVLWSSCLDGCLENYTEHRCIQTDGTDDHWSVAETWSEAQKLYANLANDRSVLMVSICDPDVRQIRGTGQFRASNFNHFKSLMRKIRKEGD